VSTYCTTTRSILYICVHLLYYICRDILYMRPVTLLLRAVYSIYVFTTFTTCTYLTTPRSCAPTQQPSASSSVFKYTASTRCPLSICVCPHTLLLLCMCPHMCALVLVFSLYVSSYFTTTIYVSSYVCPRTRLQPFKHTASTTCSLCM